MPELEDSENEEGEDSNSMEQMVNPLFLGPVGRKTQELSADSGDEGSSEATVAPVSMMNRAGYGLLPFPLIMDSGAAEHVIGPDCATRVPKHKGG